MWFFWASAISAPLVTFLFSRLWRRSGVVTDAEIIETRYGGRAAAALRLFKGFYFGILFNAFIMGWVFLAVIKVLRGLTDLDVGTILVATTVLVFVYTRASGFYGVVLTDFVQYFFAFGGSLMLAFLAVREVGGLAGLQAGLAERGLGELTGFLPRFGADNLGPISVFLTYLGVQWWAHKYAAGSGKHIQRMLSAKNEDHAFFASFFFSFINYALQVWPWILTALASLVMFGQLDDPETAYPRVMAAVLPAGLLGMVVAGLLGAFMSTIDTHLNLGASYMINDICRRFLNKDASEAHYVLMSRVMMAVLLALAVAIALHIDSVAAARKFLLTFASGAGLTWIARWFWWRVNAWSEFSAMITSGVVASYLQLRHPEWLYSAKLLTTVGLTTPVWVPVTLMTASVTDSKLLAFVEKIRPGSPGWGVLYRRHGLTPSHFLRRALVQWLAVCAGLFGLSFGIGALLLQRPGQGALLLALAAVALSVLGWLIRRDRG